MTDASAVQEAVFAFLAEPAAHGLGGGAKVRRVDTHAASVFLAGDTVLKVKRAVRFPFLDYSTLDKRKAACEAELAVNAPFAPQIYCRVVAITREAGGSLAIAGSGTPVEWAVKMHRFDETLDRKLDAIDANMADALGRVVAAAHRQAPIIKAAPWIEALRTYLDQNRSALSEFPELFEPAAVAALTQLSGAAYGRIRPLLEARGRLGRVRRGHGDLHLGNIALLDERPLLFDAIEFDPLIAAGDVLYDLAFLLMDLCERGLEPAANIVFNRYLAEIRDDADFDGLAALPFFLSLRAAIRAKVTAARIGAAAAAEQAALARAARGYFAFALRAIAPAAPKFIAVGGLSGTGKSVLARTLAPFVPPLPGAVVIRSDVERKALFEAGETDRLPAQAYAAPVTDRVYRTLFDKVRRVTAVGHSVILDAVFARQQERQDAAAAAKAANVRMHGLFLTAALATRLARIGDRGPDASDADTLVAQAQERYDLGAVEWRAIDASGTVAETAALAREALD